MKTFILKERSDFRLTVKQHECLSPNNLNSIEFVNECLNEKGEIVDTSTYNFFLTHQEIQKLCNNLLQQ
jgi:hypothetical protein